MNQSFIDALMHFFSLLLLPLPGRKIGNMRVTLEDYINKAGISFPIDECLKIYNTYSGKYFFELSSNAYSNDEEINKIQRHLILEAGQKAQENLYLQERILSILSLMEFNKLKNGHEETFSNYIQELSRSLNISEQDFEECKNFISGNKNSITKKDLILEETDESEELEGEWVSRNIPSSRADKKKKLLEKVKSNIRFHFFDSYYFIAFIYEGNHNLFINEKRTWPGYFYSFRRKDILQFEGLEPISFDEIEDHFETSSLSHKIVLSGKDLSFRYENTHYSIKPFSFREESGQIIGIIGNNGTGKTTILKLISNQLNPGGGKLFLNGTDMVANSYRLKSVIAYVSQSRIEFPDLTVYENLMYQAHLTIGNMKMADIKRRIDETLEKLSLTGIRDLKAGTSIDHSINDFQRICLRIAIEMIRNPHILFLDEPLSGLSFSDTKRLLGILKEETQKGKLIILTSQLPTSEIYNLFDKIWLIDSDGYMIYNGPPAGSLAFFRNTGLLPYYYIQSKTDLVSAEDVVKIVETKKIQTDGSVSEERQVAPGTWYDAWRAETEDEDIVNDSEVKPLPVYSSGLPGIEKQFLVYLSRNLRIRWTNLRFLVFNLIGVPLAGVLIGLVTRLTVNGQYMIAENLYVPLFFFLAVNLILLSSMFMASEEIFVEKNQVKRDLSINLSHFSYQNSKVAYILLVSLIQSFLFAWLTNLILGVNGQTLRFLAIYFSVAAFGNLLALALSESIKKLNTIFIIIPFFIIPNLLFGGYLIPFNKEGLIKNFEKPVPVIGELTPSRWAYETLVVEQFQKNPYNRYYFKEEKKLYQSNYFLNKLVPFLSEELNKARYYKYSSQDHDSLKISLSVLTEEFRFLMENEYIAPFENISRINSLSFDSTLYDEAFGYLTYLRFLMENMIIESESTIREINAYLADSLQEISINTFKNQNYNKAISNLVHGSNPSGSVYIQDNECIKEGSPVYLRPESAYGRSHFFASEKRFNTQYLSTFRFNLTALWLLNLAVYIIFLSGVMNGLLNLFRD
jgi:ABC-type multidrug transport system ATPase subunit